MPDEPTKVTSMAAAWLRQPFEMVTEARQMHADMVHRNDLNRYRVDVLRKLLDRANERLTANGCQPVVVPNLDQPSVEKMMADDPL